jgi:hypothetical protein
MLCLLSVARGALVAHPVFSKGSEDFGQFPGLFHSGFLRFPRRGFLYFLAATVFTFFAAFLTVFFGAFAAFATARAAFLTGLGVSGPRPFWRA